MLTQKKKIKIKKIKNREKQIAKIFGNTHQTLARKQNYVVTFDWIRDVDKRSQEKNNIVYNVTISFFFLNKLGMFTRKNIWIVWR